MSKRLQTAIDRAREDLSNAERVLRECGARIARVEQEPDRPEEVRPDRVGLSVSLRLEGWEETKTVNVSLTAPGERVLTGRQFGAAPDVLTLTVLWDGREIAWRLTTDLEVEAASVLDLDQKYTAGSRDGVYAGGWRT